MGALAVTELQLGLRRALALDRREADSAMTHPDSV